MATVTLPSTPAWQRSSFELVRADSAIELMNGAEVIISFGKALWAYSFSLPPMKIENGRIWASRLSQLSSFANTFTASPPEYDGPTTGYAGAQPLVKGASQTGKSLDCDGVSNSTAILKEGDYFSVNGELKVCTADATSDGSGNVTFAFEPALRSSPSDNAAVEIDAPVATFRLVNPNARWDLNAVVNFGITIDAIETVSP